MTQRPSLLPKQITSNVFKNERVIFDLSEPLSDPADFVVVHPTDPDEDRENEEGKQMNEEEFYAGTTPSDEKHSNVDPMELSDQTQSIQQNDVAIASGASSPSFLPSRSPRSTAQTEQSTPSISSPSFPPNMFPNDVAGSSQTMASLNPLTAALLVNCATVNMIAQLTATMNDPSSKTNTMLGIANALQTTAALNSLISNLLPTIPMTMPSQTSCASSCAITAPNTLWSDTISTVTSTVTSTPVVSTTGRPKRFKCDRENCQLSFTCQFNLDEHMRTHTGERPFVCPEPDCTAAFKRRRELRDHWNMHLWNLKETSDHKTDGLPALKDLSPEGSLTEARDQDVHSSVMNDSNLSLQNDIYSTRSNELRPQTKTPIRHYCTYPGCDKSYARTHRLNQHMAKHTGTGPFVCDEPNCRVRYFAEADFNRHKLAHKYAANREAHRRYKCPYADCEKAYSKMNKLKEHVRSHTGERPFVCREPGCGAAFVRLYGARRHELTHLSDKRPIKHNIDTLSSPQDNDNPSRNASENDMDMLDFDQNMMESTNTCEGTLGSVPTPGSSSNARALPVIAPKAQPPQVLRPLSPIVLPPAVRRPHVCPYKGCGKAFPKMNKLREHICRHTGERPFSCDRCNASFVRMYDLRRHSNIHLRAGYQPSQRPLAPRPLESTSIQATKGIAVNPDG